MTTRPGWPLILAESSPEEVGPGRFGGTIITYAAAGTSHSGVVTSEGGVWTWGRRVNGRLGHNDEQHQLVPRELEGQFGGARALSLAAGFAHTMVVTTCGAVWGCGRGAHGQLGVGDTADRHAPVRVGGEEAFGQSKVRMVACGGAHSVADEDGGPTGLGHDDLDDRLVPTLVAPDRLLGARIGRGLPLEPLLAVAFAMGTHRRLGAGEAAAGGGPGGERKSRRAAGKEPVAAAEAGAGSGVMALAGEPGLVKMVVELCGDWAEGWEPGEVGEGVMRLVGAGTAARRRRTG